MASKNKAVKKRRMGRPPKLNKKVIEDLEIALMLGATIDIASRQAGISDDAYYLWKRQAEEIETRLTAEQEKLEENERVRTIEAELGEDIPDPYEPDFRVTAHEANLLNFIKTMREAEALGAMEHLQNIQRNAPNDPQLSIWILQNRHGYGHKKTEIVHQGDPNNPIVTKDVSDLSIDERAAKIALIFQAAAKRAESEATQHDDDPVDG